MKTSPASVIAERLYAIAAELREHPGHWTPRAEVKTKAGAKLQTRMAGSPRAAQWGMFGFLVRDLPDEDVLSVGGGVAHPAAAALAAAVDTTDLCKWTDEFGRTSADVATAFANAAELIRKSERKAA